MSSVKGVGGLMPRYLKRIGLVFLAIIVITVLLLATGIPQARLLKYALPRALDAKVTLDGLSFWDKLSFSELSVYKRGSDQTISMVDIKGFALDYVLFPADKRHIDSLLIENLNMDIEQADPRGTIQAVPKPATRPARKSNDGKARSLKFIPKNIRINSLGFSHRSPAINFGMNNLTLAAIINGPDHYVVDINGVNAGSTLGYGLSSSFRIFSGALAIHLERDPKNIKLDPLQASFPGLIDLEGMVQIERESEEILCNVHLEKALFQDIAYSHTGRLNTPVLISFHRADLSGTKIQGPVSFDRTSMKVVWPEVALKTDIEQLRLGVLGGSLYEGDLQLHVAAQPGDLDLSADLVLNRSQKIRMAMSGSFSELIHKVELEGWSREDVLAILPLASRRIVEAVPFSGIESFTIDGRLEVLTEHFEAVLKPAFPHAQAPVELSAEGAFSIFSVLLRTRGASPLGWLESVKRFGINAAGGAITFEDQPPEAPSLMNHYLLSMNNVFPAQWFQTFTGLDALDAGKHPVNASVLVETDMAFQSIHAAITFATGFEADPVFLRQLAPLLDPRDSALLEKTAAQFDGHDSALTFTGGDLRLTRAEGSLSGELLLKNDSIELTLPVHW
jgi:hypothetical protein